MRLSRVIVNFFIILSLVSLQVSAALAQALIRDAEIEHTLRAFGDPIFTAAGLTPASVHIFVVQDDSINAYVAGGANMFIHTGLIQATRNPAMLLGVMAHETGHIAGGHLARGAEQLRDAQLAVILGYVLGAAAAIAKPDVGIGVMGASQNAIMRNMLSYSRANEQSADQAGLGFLDKLGISASGMQQMFQTLYRREVQQAGNADPYTLTHPLSAERIEHVRGHVEKSTIPADTHPAALMPLHQRMVAKLYAFIEIPPKTLQRYPQSDNSVAARMARAIAWYKIPDMAKARAEMASLIKQYPADAFLYDLQGQILFENGIIPEALTAYTHASERMPDSPLILTSLAEVQLATNTPQNFARALAALERASQLDNSNPRTWRLLATAYGKSGKEGMSHLALAEEAALEFQPDICQREADLAIAAFPAGTPMRLRAEDLKREAEELKKRKKEEE